MIEANWTKTKSGFIGNWVRMRDYVGHLRTTGADPEKLNELVGFLHDTPWDACLPMCESERLHLDHGCGVSLS